MRRTVVYLSLFVSLLTNKLVIAQDHTIYPGDDPATITITQETANNTSACSAQSTPSYCSEALPPEDTSTANQQTNQVHTIVVDAFPEHVSNISAHRLMYNTWGGRLICEYQPWFENGGNGHIDVGYDESNSATLAKQDGNMIGAGCNINLVDLYGNTDGSYIFNRQVTDELYLDLAGRAANGSYPLSFGILEDINAFYNECKNNSESDTITCVENDLKSDMDYIEQNYILPHSGLFWADGGTNVVGFFGGCQAFAVLNCSAGKDWDEIWNNVNSYVNTTENYNFKFVFQFGDFSEPQISAGEYAWPQPVSNFTSNTNQQWWWCDPAGNPCTGQSTSPAYLDRFYYQGSLNHANKLTIGLLYAGFDDSNALWGTDRVIAQQCGQVLINTAAEVTAGGQWGPGGYDIPYMMLATWNDYEEGTELEGGVDNCLNQANLSYKSGSTSVMQWTYSLNQGQTQYATINSLHHLALWTAPHNGTTLTLRKQLPYNSTSFDLSGLSLSPATYDVYLESVGQPFIQNEVSNRLVYTQQ